MTALRCTNIRLVCAAFVGMALLLAGMGTPAQAAGDRGTLQRLALMQAAHVAGGEAVAVAVARSGDDAQAAQAGAGCFDDPAGDTRRLRDDAPVADPRADIREHCVTYGAQIGLTVTVAQPSDPMTDDRWEVGTFVAWFIDTTGDDQGEYLAEYSLDQDGNLTSRVSDIREEGAPTVTCAAEAAYDGSRYVVGGIAPSCVGDASSIRVAPGAFYDAGGPEGDGPTHYDTAPNEGDFEAVVTQTDSACPNPQPAAFDDRAEISATHRPSVDCLFELGIALGTTRDGRRLYLPKVDINRGQFAGFLFRALEVLEYDLPAPSQRFRDVPSGHTFDQEIHRLAAGGVLNGFSDGTYRPNATIKRDQTATMIIQALEAVLERDVAPQAPGTHFRDIDGNVHARNIDTAFEQDLISGVEAPTSQRRGLYQPRGLTNRERMASVLVRFLSVAQ